MKGDNKMEFYEPLELEIIEFGEDDIITESNPTRTEEEEAE